MGNKREGDFLKYPNIEAERARIGITKVELSAKIGITPKTLTNWQNGKTSIPTTALVLMHDLFSCSVDYLLGIGSGQKSA